MRYVPGFCEPTAMIWQSFGWFAHVASLGTELLRIRLTGDDGAASHRMVRHRTAMKPSPMQNAHLRFPILPEIHVSANAPPARAGTTTAIAHQR